MKRAHLVLDETLLEEAVRVAGTKTCPAAADLALRDLVRRTKARRILDLAGSGRLSAVSLRLAHCVTG
jgi:Arc/MetJ family transcription regulator